MASTTEVNVADHKLTVHQLQDIADGLPGLPGLATVAIGDVAVLPCLRQNAEANGLGERVEVQECLQVLTREGFNVVEQPLGEGVEEEEPPFSVFVLELQC